MRACVYEYIDMQYIRHYNMQACMHTATYVYINTSGHALNIRAHAHNQYRYVAVIVGICCAHRQGWL